MVENFKVEIGKQITNYWTLKYENSVYTIECFGHGIIVAILVDDTLYIRFAGFRGYLTLMRDFIKKSKINWKVIKVRWFNNPIIRDMFNPAYPESEVSWSQQHLLDLLLDVTKTTEKEFYG